MPRFVLAAVSSLALLGFCVYSVVTTWVYPKNPPFKGGCDDWLVNPGPSWVGLKGCVLDVDLVIVESDQGDFEKLINRKNGVSLKPYPGPPNWIAAWIPIRALGLSSGPVKAMYRLESKDTMKWINTLERADEREKERLWADPAPIRRLSRPGLLSGKADKPTSEGLQKVLGPGGAVNVLVVIAGDPPPKTTPIPGLFAGLTGLSVLVFVARRVGRHRVDELSAEQQITRVNVSDVKLELGALEELRREERGKRPRKID